MICKVKSTIEKFNLLEGVKSLAVGVSGGADSMCLLEILSKLKQEYDIIIKVVHLNHGIRGQEALRDQRAVEAFCKKLEVECLSFSLDIPRLSKEMGIGEEECGRMKRYECYNLAACDAVATAHTLSDNIETMMFNLIRGTGTKGLCGIPPRRDNIIRPLIECTRNEIESYCEKNNILYITDSTNLSDDYTRNFIRHHIVGNFSRVNGSFENAVCGAIETLRAENDFLEKCKDELLESAFCENGYSVSSLKSVHPALRRRVLADILSRNATKDIEKRHIDLAEKAILKGEGKIEITKGLYITVANDIMFFQSDEPECEEWQCPEENGSFLTPYGKYTLAAASAGYEEKNAVDADKLKGILSMSSRRHGDSFCNRKRRNTKTLKKLFNEYKIPAFKRNSIAILREGENLVWIEGFGTDRKYLPDINTKNVLIIKKEG